MEKLKGYYVDANGNRWTSEYFTEQDAEKMSDNLIGCKDCKDCIDCKGCTKCENCISCTDCKKCRFCNDCIKCSSCFDCMNCIECRGLTGTLKELDVTYQISKKGREIEK